MAVEEWNPVVYARDGGSAGSARQGPRPATRRRVLKLQGGSCLYCQLPIGTRVKRHGQTVALTAHWDHFVPYSYLAQNPDANWVLSCQVCNGIKSDRMFLSVDAARDVILPRRIAKGYESLDGTLKRVNPKPKRAQRRSASVSKAKAKPKPKPKPKSRAGIPAPRKPIARTLPRRAVSHGCGAWWMGNRRSHCPKCCLTFATERMAELHRVGSGDSRRCVPPSDVGLVPVEHPWGTCWTVPKPSAPA